ncbi:protein-disulfide reductase DsbD, partial [Pseudomonas syringae pv. actinidiae]|nr:protein-disulfide reductase DsbD [Pseudomonas syringae pv. actinidiae]
MRRLSRFETAMRRLLCLMLLILALPASAAGLLDSRPSPTLGGGTLDNSKDFLPVRQAFQLSLIETTPESIKLRLVATDGYYLYRHRFQFRTEPADIGLGQAQLPKGEQKHDEYFGDVEVYHGILDIDLPRKPGEQRPFTLVVTYQGCADKGLCYPPETERLSIGDVAGSSPEALAAPVSASSWSWKEIALFFLAGLGLTFTPCVLPMLPILSGVVLRGKVGGLRGLSLSLAYVLPMAACFALLGALMGMFGASLNLQARLQSAWVLVPFSAFFVIFAIAMFGAFERACRSQSRSRLDRIAGKTE